MNFALMNTLDESNKPMWCKNPNFLLIISLQTPLFVFQINLFIALLSFHPKSCIITVKGGSSFLIYSNLQINTKRCSSEITQIFKTAKISRFNFTFSRRITEKFSKNQVIGGLGGADDHLPITHFHVSLDFDEPLELKSKCEKWILVFIAGATKNPRGWCYFYYSQVSYNH
jgi:hypothetical protein